MKSFLWRTLVQGTFVVLPLCVIVIVLMRTISATLAYVESIAAALPFAAVFPGPWVIAWAMVLLALACFTVGLVLGLPPVRSLVARLSDGSRRQLSALHPRLGTGARWARHPAPPADRCRRTCSSGASVATPVPERYLLTVRICPNLRPKKSPRFHAGRRGSFATVQPGPSASASARMLRNLSIRNRRPLIPTRSCR